MKILLVVLVFILFLWVFVMNESLNQTKLDMEIKTLQVEKEYLLLVKQQKDLLEYAEQRLVENYEKLGDCDKLQGILVVELIGCRHSRWTEGFIVNIGINRDEFNKAYVGAYATTLGDNDDDKCFVTDSCLFKVLSKYNILKEDGNK